MPDWEALVNSRLGDLHLCAEAQRDVVRELASHFEQIYDAAREGGAGDADARTQALDTVHDWRRFAVAVASEKETFMTMTPFRRRVLVPGLVSFLFSAVSLQLIHSLGYRGHEGVFQMFRMDYGLYAVFNVPWLLSLPLAGALGAWTSRHGGGQTRHRALAAVFPALLYGWVPAMGVITAIIYLVFGWGLGVLSDRASAAVWGERILSFLLPWVIAPALSTLVGALPFLWLKSPAQAEPTQTAHA